MAVTAAGHIAAGRFDGDGFLPGNETRNDLDLDIAQCGFLRFGEFAHIVMGETDVVLDLLRQACRGTLDLLPGDNDVAAVAVEFLRIFACSSLATGLDGIKDRLHGVADGTGIRR
jgi:hypothetical protein